ncbi:THAP domain-containing protein 3 isoform X2 [Bactrocera dorsalis]|uniref:THAP domain-containing protein 3 isoform X2 n=1 Tax=Bactrocera dorsalis TaxID=27457 RepID=A0ABM3K090_BACDO|nr:THAP domain-containing protein 3 isoform X2 [Bactrocera dorsalis]
MKCAVSNCTSHNGQKESCSFFNFPVNEELSKKWALFCRRKKVFNARTSYICMKHFKKEDIENGVEYEMGFAKKRILKRGVVPTIFKVEVSNPERKERLVQRENRRIVNELLKQNDAEHKSAVPVEEANMETLETVDLTNSDVPLLDMSNAIETPTSLEPFFETYKTPFEEIEELETKLEKQQQEIEELRKVNKKQQREISIAKQELEFIKRKHSYELKLLEKQVTTAQTEKTSIEAKLVNIFSKKQLDVLKSEMNRTHWSISDVEQAKFIYTKSNKIYNYLYNRGFPLPAVRKVKAWLNMKAPAAHLKDHCYTSELLQ